MRPLVSYTVSSEVLTRVQGISIYCSTEIGFRLLLLTATNQRPAAAFLPCEASGRRWAVHTSDEGYQYLSATFASPSSSVDELTVELPEGGHLGFAESRSLPHTEGNSGFVKVYCAACSLESPCRFLLAVIVHTTGHDEVINLRC